MQIDPKFTVIMDSYNRPRYLRQAAQAIRDQTYGNLEIILVDNGATPETKECLEVLAQQDKRVKLLHFEENQFSWDDPMKLVTCFNAGLEAATGDYVWYQSDDDLMALDYVEKMVSLLQGNPDCTTAAGLPVNMGADGKILDDGFRTTNYRPRYMPGHVLALHVIRGGPTMFSAPGTIFTIRRDVLVAAGGYHQAVELSQLYGIVPFGVTGFDETAEFYWRRHDGQLNKDMTASGRLGTRYIFSLLNDWKIRQKWQEFGQNLAAEVTSGIRRNAMQSVSHWFAVNLIALRGIACLRIVRGTWRHVGFWSLLPGSVLRVAIKALKQLVWRIFRGAVLLAVAVFPFLRRLHPRLQQEEPSG